MSRNVRLVLLFASIFLAAPLLAGDKAADKEDLHKSLSTMASMRLIATAWEAFATDTNTYMLPDAAKKLTARPAVKDATEWEQLTPVPYSVLKQLLSPTYIHTLPERDAWGTPFEFGVILYENGNAQEYFIRSLGADAKDDRVTFRRGPTGDLKSEIVFSNGSFIATARETDALLHRQEHLNELSAADRVAAIVSGSAVPFQRSGSASGNEWTAATNGTRIVVAVDAQKRLVVTSAVKLPPGTALQGAQLERLLRLQATRSPGWDMSKIVLLDDGSPAIRLSGNANELSDEGLENVLRFMTEATGEVAKVIGGGS